MRLIGVIAERRRAAALAVYHPRAAAAATKWRRLDWHRLHGGCKGPHGRCGPHEIWVVVSQRPVVSIGRGARRREGGHPSRVLLRWHAWLGLGIRSEPVVGGKG